MEFIDLDHVYLFSYLHRMVVRSETGASMSSSRLTNFRLTAPTSLPMARDTHGRMASAQTRTTCSPASVAEIGKSLLNLVSKVQDRPRNYLVHHFLLQFCPSKVNRLIVSARQIFGSSQRP